MQFKEFFFNEALKGQPLKRVKLGNTELEPSLLGLGGGGIIERPDKRSDAMTVLSRAYDLGINYFDTAWHYGNTVSGGVGESERRIGEFAKGKRDKVILATKTPSRNYQTAKRQIDESLQRLKTDHVDILQLHHVNSKPDWDKCKKNNLRAILEAKQAGKTRYVGITGHRNPRAILEAIKEMPVFDTALISLNAADVHHESFIKNLLPQIQDLGVIAMKVFAYGTIFNPDGITEPQEAIDYVYSLGGVDMSIIGVDNLQQLEQNVSCVKNRKKLTSSQMRKYEGLTRKYHPICLFYRKGMDHYNVHWS